LSWVLVLMQLFVLVLETIHFVDNTLNNTVNCTVDNTASNIPSNMPILLGN